MLGLAASHAQAQQPEAPIQASLCEIKAHPEKYLKKLVEFTAIASHGFEDSMVEDSPLDLKRDSDKTKRPERKASGPSNLP